VRLLKQSTAANVMVFMTDSADHVAGKTGLTLTITASKNGAAFASISPTVTERGNGWYNLALTTAHTDTLGDLAVHVTASGADPTDFLCRVSARLVDDVLPTSSYTAPDNATITAIAGYTDSIESRLPAALVGGRMDSSVGSMASNVLTAAALATDAVTEIQSGLATSTTLAIVLKILRNKVVTNPSTGQIIVYDDDSVTPLLTGNLFEDVAGTQAYQGQGADRRDRMT